MKSLIEVLVVGGLLAASATVFAQSNSPVTREQVRAELLQLQQAGYHVGDGDQTHYPEAVQAAEARVAAAQNAHASGFGGSIAGSTQSGAATPAVSKADWNAMYSR